MKTLKILLLLLLVPIFNGYSQDSNLEDGKLLNLNGTELYVRTIGEGEPIIVIHGGPVLDHSYLLPHFKSLAESYQLIFFDQRLSGRSSADVDTSDIRMETFIKDIEALRDSLNLDKVHILGHSWGGLLAMQYAIKYTDRAKTLILLNSMPPSSDLWQKEQAQLAKITTKEDSLARQQIIQSELFKSNPSEAVKKLLLLSFKNQFHNPGLIDSLELYVPKDYMARRQLFGNLMQDLKSYNLVPDLKKLVVPTLVIYGKDEPASELSGSVLAQTIPNSRQVIINKSGHFPFVERPDEFQLVITRFLESVE